VEYMLRTTNSETGETEDVGLEKLVDAMLTNPALLKKLRLALGLKNAPPTVYPDQK
jgi:uncharacterized protein YehS (DUF1456 family)